MTERAGDLSLAGVRVVEWGDFVAVPYAARLLADAGAQVVKVEPPEGDSSRREGPFPSDVPDPEASGLFAYFNRGKRSVVLDLAGEEGRGSLRELIAVADVLVHEQISLATSPLGLSADELRALNPALVVVSVTPFGETGPRGDHKSDDLIVVASSGLAFATPGLPDHVSDWQAEPPLRANTNLGEAIGGLIAASGALVGLLNRDRTGAGLAVEVSKQEALAGLLTRELGQYTYGGVVVGRHPAKMVLSPNHYLPVADGWAAVVAFTDAHWRSFVELMGNPDWTGDPRFATAISRGDHWDDLEPLLLGWLLERSGWELLEQTQSRGIPCAPAFTIQEAVENVHIRAREMLVPSGLPLDERGRLPGDVMVVDGRRRPSTSRVPGLGADTEAVLKEWLAKTTDGGRRTEGGRRMAKEASSAARPPSPVLPLSGVRVVDLGQVVAMPLAAQWLAFLGAEVIRVESHVQMLTRSFSPFAGEPSPETSSSFNHINRNKRSCTLNLRTPEGQALARRLIGTADVLLENMSPGTMAKLGLDYEALTQPSDGRQAVRPNLIMVSLSALGGTGPWKGFSGLHSVTICLSGLAAVTGYSDGYPRLVGSILPDPIAAAYCTLAVLQGLYQRRRTGRGMHFDLAMTEALQSLIPAAILEYTMQGHETVRIGNRHPWKAPHGVYQAAGYDRWVALSVSNEEEWRQLCRVIGRPQLAAEARFVDAAARRANADALDEIITTWSLGITAEEGAERLQEAGVPATLVYDPRDILADEHLNQRGFIVTDEHPRAGAKPMPGTPWRFSDLPPVTYRHAPLLGEGNTYVFGELLGLSSTELERLQAENVIY